MTPDQFLLEYWKEYRAYMASKEHLIEIATTLYLAFVSALILRDDAFWVDRNRRWFAVAVWILTTLLTVGFARSQFRYWSNAARICNASQSLMARWFAKTPDDADLVPVSEPSFPDVDVPKALADELRRRRERWNNLSRCRRVCGSPFEIAVYGLGLLWIIALGIRIWAAVC